MAVMASFGSLLRKTSKPKGKVQLRFDGNRPKNLNTAWKIAPLI
jgi:hypothetical protein